MLTNAGARICDAPCFPLDLYGLKGLVNRTDNSSEVTPAGSSQTTGLQRLQELGFDNVLGKKENGWAVFFQRKTMGKLIRQAVDDMLPFALEMWLGHDDIVFVGKGLFNRTNEK